MAVIGLVVVLALSDWGLGAFMSTTDPTIKKSKGSRNGAAVLVLGDEATSTKALTTPHKKVLSRYGDPVSVEFSQDSFDADAIVKKTHKQLLDWGYKRVIIVGVGLGGQIGTDLIDYDRTNGRHFQFSVVLADAQTSVDDTEHSMKSWFFSWWHAGPMADFVCGKLSPGYPTSGWTAQLRYGQDHLGYRPDAYSGIPMAFLQSSDDGDVKKEAATNWQRIFGKGKVITVAGSPHAGLIKSAGAWDKALGKALDQVG